jgi:hypothetical protein
MNESLDRSRRFLPALVLCAVAATIGATPTGKDDKPSISVKSSVSMGFAPFHTVLTADIRGGADDYEPFYCATVEWDMDDGTIAEQEIDCEPYEAGKSQIQRRFVREQVFNSPGEFHVTFRLKQKKKVVGAGQTTIRVRPGLQDFGVGGY